MMKKHNIKGSLITNGLFDRNFLEILDSEVIAHVQISYNDSNQRGVWEENLKRLKGIMPNICLRFNIGSLDDSYEDVLNVAKNIK
ncbi:hypothetical protein KEJ44_06205 [Candidatus Bathyarchaeota archaeon]|nr:hypothetical protein [Candidatus Bathyarchaeota archaeon]